MEGLQNYDSDPEPVSPKRPREEPPAATPANHANQSTV